MKRYSEETEKWIAATKGQGRLFGGMTLRNGVLLLSAVSNRDLAITDKVVDSGFALWRAVNENPRIRRFKVVAKLEEHRAFWSRITNYDSPVYQFLIEKELEPTHIDDTFFREMIFSEEFTVSASGTETLQSKDVLSEKIAKSNFRVLKAPSNENLVDVGIITIRDDELHAVLDQFKPGEDPIPGKNRTYSAANIEAKSGQTYRVAIVQCAGQGEGNGQNTARDLIEDLNPLWIFLVGIAGAVPAREFTLGDVLVANRLHDFTVSAWKEDTRPTYEVEGGVMHPLVVDLLNALKMIRNLGNWNSPQSIGCDRPAIVVDSQKFQGDDAWKKKLQESLEYHSQSGRDFPEFRVSPFGSSDALMRDTSRFQQWLESARHLEAVETELGGVYRASRRKNREYPIIAIRGISDIVGLERDENWQEYACKSAAAFAHAILRSGMLSLGII